MKTPVSTLLVLVAALIVSVGGYSGIAFGEEPASAPEAAPAGTATPAASATMLSPEERVEEQLRQVVSCEFIDTPLSEAVSYWAKTTGIEIQIDVKALEEVGVGTAVPITLVLRQVNLRSALNHMLNQLELTWLAVDGLVVITTEEVVESKLQLQVYPVRDLIQFTDEAGEAQENADDLIELINGVVHPNTWDAVGGPASISEFNGQLIIAQTLEVHQQTALLLAALRKLPPAASPEAGQVIAPLPLENSDAQHQRIAAALEKNMTLDVFEQPLRNVVDALAKRSEINILLDIRRLEEIGVGVDTPVSHSSTDLSLGTVLKLITSPLDLAVLIQDEVLLITSRERAHDTHVIVVYPALDLLPLPATTTSRDLAMVLEELQGAIFSSVETNTWNDVGGPGDMTAFTQRGALVILNSPDVHEQIAELLAQIRAVRKSLPAEANAPTDTPDKILTIGYELVYHSPPLSDKGEPLAPLPEHIDSKQLSTLIQELVAPGSWQQAPDVLIRELPDRLLVRHEKRVHREIEILLHQLGVNYVSGVRGDGANARLEGGRFIGRPAPYMGPTQGSGIFNLPRE